MALADKLTLVEKQLQDAVTLHQRAIQAAQQAERDAIALDAQAKLLRELIAEDKPDGD